MKYRKLNLIDSLINVVSPTAFNKRIIARAQNEFLMRQYDAAKSPNGQSRILSNSNTANKEIKSAQAPIRYNAREIVRNQPVAVKAVSVLTNEVISWGIEPTIKHSDSKTESILRKAFKEWARNCGTLGENYYQLQQLAFQSMVIDGESGSRQVILDKRVKIQLFESDLIDTTVDNITTNQGSAENGIIQDNQKRPVAYALKKEKGHEFVLADEIIHLFRKDRIGQNRGVSWLAPVISTIWTLDQINYAQLNKQLLGSALTAVIKKQQSGIAPDIQQAQLQEDFNLTAGSVLRLNEGEDITIPQGPNDSSFDPHFKNTLRLIASGLGITYEALSCDLSQVNFSSARIGHIQFKKNIDSWRYQTVIPQFCEKTFLWFLKDCQMRGIETRGIEVEWTPPAHGLIDPKSEIEATKAAIRAGLQTYPQALKELGYDPETQMDEIKKSNEDLDKRGLILEIDPRYTGNGQLASKDSLTAIKDLQG